MNLFFKVSDIFNTASSSKPELATSPACHHFGRHRRHFIQLEANGEVAAEMSSKRCERSALNPDGSSIVTGKN